MTNVAGLDVVSVDKLDGCQRRDRPGALHQSGSKTCIEAMVGVEPIASCPGLPLRGFRPGWSDIPATMAIWPNPATCTALAIAAKYIFDS